MVDKYFRATSAGNVAFTPEEEAAEDARLASVAAAAPRLATLDRIAALEATITPRRMRDAVLLVDNGWLSGVENLIALERAKL